MTENQEKLFKLLCEFDDTCSKHDIAYILSGGAALGTALYGGFLPWSDDVDILMTSDNSEKLDAVLNSTEESNPVDLLNIVISDKYPEELWVKERVFLEFEGRKFPFSERLFHCIREIYGYNWNILPDEESKGQNIENAEAFEVQRQRAMVCNRFLQAEANRLEKKSIVFKEAQHKKIKEQLSNFLEYFFMPDYIKFRMPVELNHELKRTVLMTLVFDDEIDRAESFLEIYPEWEEYAKYSDMLYCLEELKLEKYYGNRKGVKQYLTTLKSKYDLANQIEVIRTDLWYLSTSNPLFVKFEMKVLNRVRKRVKSFSDPLDRTKDLEYQKYLGDMLLISGQRERAAKRYEAVLDGSRNGMILKDIKD